MTTWVDITDLMAWRGHMTGIQRVVYNIAQRIQRDNKNTKFFYYEPRERKFFEKEIDLTAWLESNSQIAVHASLTTKQKLANITPHKIKLLTPKPVKNAILKTGKFALDKKGALKSKFTLKQKYNYIQADIKTGDTVLILGNGWDNINFMEDIGEIKSQKGFKLVNIVYDLIPIFEPQYFGGMVTKNYTNYIFESVTNCDLLLPISKSTENDVFRFCNLIDAPQPKTSVIRLGDEVTQDNLGNKPKWIKNTKFVLCVGTIEIRKNHTLLYYAYKNLISKGFEPPLLVIVGKRGWYTDDVVMLFQQDTAVRKYIQIAENTSDDELVWLYKNCMFTIYPSLYEGWGLPVAESLAYGKPVICSNSSSIPEAGGNLAEYFSPFDVVSCSNLIIKYCQEIDRDKLVKKIKSDYGVKTWEDCYLQVVALISH